jgi:hypothetical protein
MLTGAALAMVLSASAPAFAGDVASRCGDNGCDRIHCDYSGNHCVRYSDYDGRYNGYTNGYDNGGYYGGSGQSYDNGYRYGGYGPSPYDRGAYGGYDGGYARLVCDNTGSRCYRSNAPYWNYREYYRLHGYRWRDRDDRD